MKSTSILFVVSVQIATLACLPTWGGAELIGHWEFEEGAGTTAADSAGVADAALNNVAWGSDGTRASFVTFSGEPGSYADPSLNVPAAFLGTAGNFTVAFWVNRAVGDAEPNSVVVGNRNNSAGADFVPRQFVKFTPTKFEFHMDGNGNDNFEPGPDMVNGEWHHEAVTMSNGTLQYYRDGVALGSPKAVTQSLTFDQPLYFGGQANNGGGGEFFNGSLDDIRLYDNALTAAQVLELVEAVNFPPRFDADPIEKPDAVVGVAYSDTLAGAATDPNPGDTVTYSLVSGPSWLQIAEGGALSGTPAQADSGYNVFTVQASDGVGSNTAKVVILVGSPVAPGALFGWWPMDEGSGDMALDVSGNKFHATIMNPDTGGLNEDGSVWVEDPECGTVLSFNGVDGTGAFAVAGIPPIFGMLPIFSLDDDFTWSLWVKSDQVADTSIVLGNRFDHNGVNYDPQEFIKFTGLTFEWHQNVTPENVDYADLVQGEWVHLVIVKEDNALTHYRDGSLAETMTITGAPANAQPIYFGGQGFENWRGYMTDVRLFNSALTGAEALELSQSKGVGTGRTLEFTQVAVDASKNVTLTWRSRTGAKYALDASGSMLAEGVNPGGWFEVDDSIDSQGDSTTTVLQAGDFPFPENFGRMFFRVSETPPN